MTLVRIVAFVFAQADPAGPQGGGARPAPGAGRIWGAGVDVAAIRVPVATTSASIARLGRTDEVTQ